MLAFGLSSVFYKLFYGMGFDSLSLSLYLPLISAVALFLQKFSTARNLRFLKIGKKDFLLSFVNAGIVGLFVTNVSILLALRHTSVGVQQLITNSSPIMALFIYTVILRRKPKKQDVISCALILLGLYFVVGKIDISGSKESLIGLLFCFASTVSIAINTTIINENPTDYDNTAFWFYAFMGYFTVSVIRIFLLNGFSSVVPFTDLKSFLFVFFAVYFSCTLPYSMYKIAAESIGVMKTLIITSFAPVVSLILDCLLFKENITLLQCIGFVVVFLALIMPAFVKE
jgi:drug/metabolite transporter (DMT)-like permease